MAKTLSEAQLVAMLNDLLQLDHDAVQAYSLAIDGIQSPEHRQTLIRFRGDHERHVRDLTELIESHGGVPIQLSHVPSGPMKLAVQAVGNLGSDREVLLAFKSNERQARDKYHRLADDPHPADVAAVLNRNAADEERHYAWVSQVLERMGAGRNTGIGRAEEAFETVHGRAADMIEGAERGAMVGVERMRRSPIRAVLFGIAGLLILRKVLRSAGMPAAGARRPRARAPAASVTRAAPRPSRRACTARTGRSARATPRSASPGCSRSPR